MMIKALLSICMSKKIGLNMSFKTTYTCNWATLTIAESSTIGSFSNDNGDGNDNVTNLHI